MVSLKAKLPKFIGRVQGHEVTQDWVLGEFAPISRVVLEKIHQDTCRPRIWPRIVNLGVKEFWFRLHSVWNTPSRLHFIAQNWFLPPAEFCHFKPLQSQSLWLCCCHVDGCQLLTGSDPWKRAKCQAEGGKPVWEHKEHSCSHLHSKSTRAGGFWCC